MRKTFLTIAALCLLTGCVSGNARQAPRTAEDPALTAPCASEETAPAAAPKVSILGDSYSTFEGFIPEGYIAWYKPVPKEGRPTDVTQVDQTWWSIFMEENGYELEANNSYSGSTVCNTGYEGKDYSDRSFVNRVGLLGNPDLILVFGGTNDSWAGSPMGEFVWCDWTDEQLKAYRPATACMVSRLQSLYPRARLVLIGNDEIKDEVKESTAEICAHYGVEYVQLEGIEKMSGHPDRNGMRKIAEVLGEMVGSRE